MKEPSGRSTVRVNDCGNRVHKVATTFTGLKDELKKEMGCWRREGSDSDRCD